MALILNIDSSTSLASVCLALDGNPVGQAENGDQKDHASWLHIAIQALFGKTSYKLNQLQAVAVTSGPGSYTGLRVGMSAAKGLCYALNIPFITENTLRIMAMAFLEKARELKCELICPMVDARRMEVFTAIYDTSLEVVKEPHALVLEPDSLVKYLEGHSVIFVGNGSGKWKQLNSSSKSFFSDISVLAPHLAIDSEKKFHLGQFTDIRYSEPVYLKEFYTHVKK